MSIKNSEVGEVAFKLHEEIMQNEKSRRGFLLKNMQLMSDMSDGLYKVVLGDEDAPWSAYLSQFEVFYSRSKVDTMTRVYKKFVKELGLLPESIIDVPFSKLLALMPFVTKENVESWLLNARTLTAQDFNDEIRKAKGGVGYMECEHKKVTKYEICNTCGFRHKD